MKIVSVPCTPRAGQKPGTSGLRKKVSVFSQPGYLETYVQSLFDCLPERAGQALVLGGVEAVTLSNNHTRDFGDAGLRDTEAALAEYGVAGIPGNQRQCFELRHDNGDTLRLGAYVHPFNDPAIATGQGTISYEIFQPVHT